MEIAEYLTCPVKGCSIVDQDRLVMLGQKLQRQGEDVDDSRVLPRIGPPLGDPLQVHVAGQSGLQLHERSHSQRRGAHKQEVWHHRLQVCCIAYDSHMGEVSAGLGFADPLAWMASPDTGAFLNHDRPPQAREDGGHCSFAQTYEQQLLAHCLGLTAKVARPLPESFRLKNRKLNKIMDPLVGAYCGLKLGTTHSTSNGVVLILGHQGRTESEPIFYAIFTSGLIILSQKLAF